MMGVSCRRTKMAGPLPVLIPDQNRGAMRVGIDSAMPGIRCRPCDRNTASSRLEFDVPGCHIHTTHSIIRNISKVLNR